MNYREAYAAAILGERVTCDRLGPGTFVDYRFAGLRINLKGGSHSGYTATAEDRAAEWRLFEPDNVGKPWPKPEPVLEAPSRPVWPKKKELPKWN